MDLDRQRRIRAVLDTNVLLGSERRRLLLLVGLDAYQLVTSQYILDEVQRIMVRLGWSSAGADAQLQAIRLVAEIVDEQTITGGNTSVPQACRSQPIAMLQWQHVYGRPFHGAMTMIADRDRITFDPAIMGGRACIRGMRITVALVLNLVANGMSVPEILDAYPYLDREDVQQALRYAAWLADERVYAVEPALV